MSKILCIYHDHCTDGFAAAWAVRAALGDAAEYRAASYNEAPPDVAGRDVLLVDFSYKRPVLDAMAAAARSLLVLDHHKTAAEDLAGIGIAPENWETWRESIDERDRPPLRCAAWFDMERSGAGLAWDFFHDASRPWLVNLVELRDLWRQDDYRWTKARALHAYLNSFTFDFREWDEHARLTQTEEGRDAVLTAGWAILRQADKHLAELIAITKRRLEIGGTEVPVACLPPWMASDGGHLLGEGEAFAASYYDSAKGRAFSLRSRPDGADVAAIAKLYGGGGHQHAAGFFVARDHALARA